MDITFVPMVERAVASLVGPAIVPCCRGPAFNNAHNFAQPPLLDSDMKSPMNPQAYYKGYFMRGQGKWPGLERWFLALEQRPT